MVYVHIKFNHLCGLLSFINLCLNSSSSYINETSACSTTYSYTMGNLIQFTDLVAYTEGEIIGIM